MRYLGLDLGTKTLGIAISDKTNTIANPLKTLRFTTDNTDEIIDDVVDIINKYNITNVVLGLPKNMNNSLGFASQRSIDFQKILEKYTDVKIELLDERLTTVEAENILISADVSRTKRKKVIDALAATIILETYLRMKGK